MVVGLTKGLEAEITKAYPNIKTVTWTPDICVHPGSDEKCVLRYYTDDKELPVDGNQPIHCYAVDQTCPSHKALLLEEDNNNKKKSVEEANQLVHDTILKECQSKSFFLDEALKAMPDKLAQVVDIDANTGEDVYTLKDGVEFKYEFVNQPGQYHRLLQAEFIPNMKAAVVWARSKGFVAKSITQRQKHLANMHLTDAEVATVQKAVEKRLGKNAALLKNTKVVVPVVDDDGPQPAPTTTVPQ